VSPTDDTDVPMEPRLSELQRVILRHILSEALEVGLLSAQIPWAPSDWLGPWTRADAAAASRALHRLERRGLVERLPTRPAGAHRTTHVRLTDRGWAVADRLLFPPREWPYC
jgi:DNA-binding PadR family transcriptional regulator